MLYGKDTLKMEEVEATLLSHEKRRKVEDCQSSVFAAQGRNKKGRQTVKEFNCPNRSKSIDGKKDKQCYKCLWSLPATRWNVKMGLGPPPALTKAGCQKCSNEDNSTTTPTRNYMDIGEDVLTISAGNISYQSEWILVQVRLITFVP
ncbi:hypothetical protein GBA52_020915 [Prunus armeniaca]|nr:hypothetical protein GBA52_020915 [Prunus armeniaca]